jgi:hypothetical protein
VTQYASREGKMKNYDKQQTFEEKLRAGAKEEPAYRLLREAFDTGYLNNALKNNLFQRVRRYLETGILLQN